MIAASMQLLLSAPQAPSGYVTPGSVYNSLGRWCSTTQIDAATPAGNLFPDITGPENAAAQVDYQCVFAANADLTDTAVNVTAWIPQASVAGLVQWAVGADPAGASPLAQTVTPQAAYITSPTIAPAGVTAWAGPSADVTGGTVLGMLAPGQAAAFWVRRTAVNSPAATCSFQLQVTFDVMTA